MAVARGTGHLGHSHEAHRPPEGVLADGQSPAGPPGGRPHPPRDAARHERLDRRPDRHALRRGEETVAWKSK